MRKWLTASVAVTAIVAATLVVPTGTAGAVRHRASGGYGSLLNSAIADLQAYWAKEFPQAYGASYEPVAQILEETVAGFRQTIAGLQKYC
jgi:hypothetical protein